MGAETTCEVCGLLEYRCGVGSEDSCYRLGYEREKARAEKAEAELATTRTELEAVHTGWSIDAAQARLWEQHADRLQALGDALADELGRAVPVDPAAARAALAAWEAGRG